MYLNQPQHHRYGRTHGLYIVVDMAMRRPSDEAVRSFHQGLAGARVRRPGLEALLVDPAFYLGARRWLVPIDSLGRSKVVERCLRGDEEGLRSAGQSILLWLKKWAVEPLGIDLDAVVIAVDV